MRYLTIALIVITLLGFSLQVTYISRGQSLNGVVGSSPALFYFNITDSASIDSFRVLSNTSNVLPIYVQKQGQGVPSQTNNIASYGTYNNITTFACLGFDAGNYVAAVYKDSSSANQVYFNITYFENDALCALASGFALWLKIVIGVAVAVAVLTIASFVFLCWCGCCACCALGAAVAAGESQPVYIKVQGQGYGGNI